MNRFSGVFRTFRLFSLWLEKGVRSLCKPGRSQCDRKTTLSTQELQTLCFYLAASTVLASVERKDHYIKKLVMVIGNVKFEDLASLTNYTCTAQFTSASLATYIIK
jgi:hypothetical protein